MSEFVVPLTVSTGAGKRKVIGRAVVDVDGKYVNVTGVITDEEYKAKLSSDVSGLSIGPFAAPRENT